MPTPPEETLSGDILEKWLKKGPKKLTIDDEIEFVDSQILKGILNSKVKLINNIITRVVSDWAYFPRVSTERGYTCISAQTNIEFRYYTQVHFTGLYVCLRSYRVCLRHLRSKKSLLALPIRSHHKPLALFT